MNTRIKLRDAKGIGVIIKKGCLAKGIAQKELAKRIGISINSMSRIVRCVDTPNEDVVKKIEEELGLTKGQIERMVVREENDDKTRYSPSKKERKVLEAWDCGKLSPQEVSIKTGYSINVIARYLPINEDAQYVDC